MTCYDEEAATRREEVTPTRSPGRLITHPRPCSVYACTRGLPTPMPRSPFPFYPQPCLAPQTQAIRPAPL